jgi:hypothetical protein
MPPHGLYPIPQHHLYNGSKHRPSFNTMDFAHQETEAAISEHVSQNHGNGEMKKYEKMKREHSHDEERDVPVSASNSVISNMKTKCSSKNNRNEEDEKSVSHSFAKKRKRESEGKTEMLSLAHSVSTDGFVIGGDILRNLEASMGSMGEDFVQWSSPMKKSTELQKKRKEKKKKTGKMGKNLAENLSEIPAQVFKDSKKKKKKKQKSGSAASDELGNKSVVTQTGSSTTKSPYVTAFRKSHVPLPPSRQLSTYSALKLTEQEKKQTHDSDGIKVPTTPLSNATRTPQHGHTTTSFPKPSFNDTLRAVILPPNKEPRTPVRLPLSSYYDSDSGSKVDLDTQTSKLSVSRNKDYENGRLSSQLGLSPATLDKVLNIRAVNEEEQAGCVTRQVSGGSSTATSLPSSSSSTSFPALFNRVGMPYARSGAGSDAFVQLEVKEKDSIEMHEESNLKTFRKKFRHAQQTINFSDELDYLKEYLTWNAANYAAVPYPCLSKATGCNARKEAIIQSAKDQGQIVNRFQESGGINLDAMTDASFRTQKAEEFLMTTIRARIPVPIGTLAGEYKLFSPKYSEHHYDLYCLGERTLTIYSVAGMKAEGAFKARLNIKPRPASFVIQPFTAPPHASFRTTVITTTPEGANPVRYKIEVVFLGNGYLQLRADLNSLLRGKQTEAMAVKSSYMEFLGVHEKALQWKMEIKDEIQEEGKRLFAKYGSMDDD